MEHIKKADREAFSKGSVTSFEYALAQASLNLSPIHLEGDEVHIAPKEAYAFVGELDIVYAATPPWTPEQAELVD